MLLLRACAIRSCWHQAHSAPDLVNTHPFLYEAVLSSPMKWVLVLPTFRSVTFSQYFMLCTSAPAGFAHAVVMAAAQEIGLFIS